MYEYNGKLYATEREAIIAYWDAQAEDKPTYLTTPSGVRKSIGADVWKRG